MWMENNPLQPKYSERSWFPAAHGVRRWYRNLAGRSFMFTLVVESWWGVGEAGTVRVYKQICNGDWYKIRTFMVKPGTDPFGYCRCDSCVYGPLSSAAS